MMNHFAAIRCCLERWGLDAMFLTGEANRFYASGFHSDGTDGAALVTKETAYYWTDSRYIEAAAEQVRDAELALVTPERGYAELLKEAAARHGLSAIGFEDESMTVSDWRRYEKKTALTFIAASGLPEELRMVKSAEELEALTAAQRIAERALEEIYNDIRPGVTEKELAARLTYLMLRYGAENVSFDPIVASGANGSKPHAVPTEKPIAAGEFVTMDFGCIFHGYCSDMTRTVAVGPVTEEMERVYRIVLDAQEAGIAAAREGVPGCDVHAAAARVIADAGYGAYFGHGFGHGVGVEIHEKPRASLSWKKPLPAGAVLSAEPGIYLPGRFGVRIEDVIVIRSDGCENLHRAPKNLRFL